jgi:hypothetical protein
MHRLFLTGILFSVLLLFSVQAYAQEPRLATFQESAQVIIDQRLSNNVTASITLQSTSNQEIKIPSELDAKIRGTERLTAVIITNEEQCVLGVTNQSCIMINIDREGLKGIREIQDTGKAIGNTLIDDLNKFFDTKAKFHSVFVHYEDESNRALETSGTISGRGKVSVVYTMPKESTDSMYEKMTAILLPKVIRDSGGFYEIAKNLSKNDKSQMTMSIIPVGNSNLYQIKLSREHTGQTSTLGEIKPLDFLETNELKRSNYFANGFYPLNSIFQIVILTDDAVSIKNVKGKILETQIVDGEKIPVDITSSGWVFDPESGKRIQGKYLFGKNFELKKNELQFLVVPLTNGQIPEIQETESESDDSLIIIGIIAAVSVGAAIYYLKGYRKSS